MAKIPKLKQTFRNEEVVIDNTSFVECSFIGSTLVYKGGIPPDMVDCSFDQLRVTFEGPAENALKMMSKFYSGFGEGGRQFMEQTFENIKKGL